MALSFEPFIDDLRAQVATAWTEVKGNGIWDGEHANRMPWVDYTLPYAVMLIPNWPRPTRQALTTLEFQPTVQFFYVASTLGKAVALRGKLAALIDVFYPTHSLTTGQVWRIGDVSVGDDLLPNQVFAAANHSARAGAVSITFRMGITKSG